MEKKKKSQYESSKIYNKKYNKTNINIQLNRELISKLRDSISPKTIKSFLEEQIITHLEKGD